MWTIFYILFDFPGGSDGKESAYKAGDPGSILGWEGPLEMEMATHSSILAWKIPWTEEPGRLQSMGSQRVGHDWATSLSFFLFSLCMGYQDWPSCTHIVPQVFWEALKGLPSPPKATAKSNGLMLVKPLQSITSCVCSIIACNPSILSPAIGILLFPRLLFVRPLEEVIVYLSCSPGQVWPSLRHFTLCCTVSRI